MSVLTLVRHGQASYMSHEYDRLSAMGEEQAARLGRYWAKHRIAFDRVISGPAERHLRTANIAGAAMRDAGLPWPAPRVMPEFDEFDAFTVMRRVFPLLVEDDEQIRLLNDEFVANQHTPEAGRKLQKLFEAVARRWATSDLEVDTVESFPRFRQRIGAAVDALRASAQPSTNTVVFTSGGPISATIGHALQLSHTLTIEFVWLSRNCSYSQFLFSGDRFSLHAFNAIPHFEDLSMFTYR
jgi:broad specificity phosphatase PhoE